MKKIFIFLITFYLAQFASAKDSTVYICLPLKPTPELKEVHIDAAGNFSYFLTVIYSDTAEPTRYKAEYGDDINFPTYFSTESGVNISVEFYEPSRNGNIVDGSFIRDGHDDIPVRCVDVWK